MVAILSKLGRPSCYVGGRFFSKTLGSQCSTRRGNLNFDRFLASLPPPEKQAKSTSGQQNDQRKREKYSFLDDQNMDSLYYILGLSVLFGGLAYASVPLYRIFCQKTGFGGTTQVARDLDKIEALTVRTDRSFRVKFDSTTNYDMPWRFEPQQPEIIVRPGETALAFFTAKNPTDKPIIGIATYNIVPFDAGAYFNKIQCFCFEEQLLNPGEEVDMPVFFYLDPDICDDPNMHGVKTLILSYTFFMAKEGLMLPAPMSAPHDRTVPPGFKGGNKTQALMAPSPNAPSGGNVM